MKTHLALIVMIACTVAATTQPTTDQIRKWKEEAKADKVEAHVRVVQFAMQALEDHKKAEFDALPEFLRDATPWWVDEKPAGEWSTETREFVLGRFRDYMKKADRKLDHDKMSKWLAERDPLAGTTIEFFLIVSYWLDGKGLSQGVTLNGPDEFLKVDRFLQSLVQQQKLLLVSGEGRLPLKDLTREQHDLALAVMNREATAAKQPDPAVRISFQFNGYVRRGPRTIEKGSKEFYEVILASFSGRRPSLE